MQNLTFLLNSLQKQEGKQKKGKSIDIHRLFPGFTWFLFQTEADLTY